MNFSLNNLQKRLTRTTSSGNYIAVIDGLRFFAIAPVLIHHLAERISRVNFHENLSSQDEAFFDFLPNGPFGVELFFVISGFVISSPILKQWSNGNIDFNFGKYFSRRLTRLEPPFILVMTMSFIVISLLITKDSNLSSGARSFANDSISLTESFLASLVYLHGLIFNAYPRVNPPAWSLEIEFQFYIVAPLLLIGIYKLIKKSPKQLFVSILAFFALVILIKVCGHYFLPLKVQKYVVSRYIEYFVSGFVACQFILHKYHEKRFLKSNSSIIFVIALLIAYFADHSIIKGGDFWLNQALNFLKLISFFLIFITAFSGGIGQKITSNRWIAIIGGMCYTIYLIHLMFFQIGVKVLSQVVSTQSLMLDMLLYSIVLIPVLMVLSVTFFLLVEKPCMNPAWLPNLLKKR